MVSVPDAGIISLITGGKRSEAKEGIMKVIEAGAMILVEPKRVRPAEICGYAIPMAHNLVRGTARR